MLADLAPHRAGHEDDGEEGAHKSRPVALAPVFFPAPEGRHPSRTLRHEWLLPTASRACGMPRGGERQGGFAHDAGGCGRSENGKRATGASLFYRVMVTAAPSSGRARLPGSATRVPVIAGRARRGGQFFPVASCGSSPRPTFRTAPAEARVLLPTNSRTRESSRQIGHDRPILGGHGRPSRTARGERS